MVARCRPRENTDGVLRPHPSSRADYRLLRGDFRPTVPGTPHRLRLHYSQRAHHTGRGCRRCTQKTFVSTVSTKRESTARGTWEMRPHKETCSHVRCLGTARHAGAPHCLDDKTRRYTMVLRPHCLCSHANAIPQVRSARVVGAHGRTRTCEPFHLFNPRRRPATATL